MQAHHTTRSWLTVEWHLGVGGISLLNFCNAYSSLPGNNHCPLPGDVCSSLPGNICQCSAWTCLQSLPGTLASSLPGNACQCACPAWVCLQSLPGTLASPVPGNACQFPASERLPMPCLGMFASPCLGMLLAWTLSLCSFLMLICTSSSLICHTPLQNNDSKKKPLSLVCHTSSKITLERFHSSAPASHN